MTARGLGGLGLALGGALLGVAALSLLVGAAAGYPVARSLSGGFVLVGALLFVAGALSGLRAPGSRDDARPEAAHERAVVARILVGAGLGLVVLGIALDPDSSL